jgi:hypothetical protein
MGVAPAMTAKPKRRWYQFSLGMLFVLLTAACIVVWWDPFRLRPPAPVPIETVPLGTTARVDVIELNEQFDAPQRPNFQQVIFWSRYPDRQLHIRQWKLVGDSRTKNFQLDRSSRSQCTCSWTRDGIDYRVEAPVFRESKAAGDPELLDRKAFPKPDRQPLWK